MDFSAMEKAVYGHRNLEDDPELMAELLALEEEEKRSHAPPPTTINQAARGLPRQPSTATFGIDPSVMAAALADTVTGDVDCPEDDEDLLNELSGIVGEPTAAAPAPPTRTAPPPPVANARPSASPSHNLRELLKVYEKMKNDSEKENNAAKTRRLQRSTDKLKELVVRADKGLKIDPSEIPPAPPGWQLSNPTNLPTPTPVASVEPIVVPPVAKPAHHPAANPVRSAAHSSPETPPPAAPQPPSIPARKESTPAPRASAPTSKKEDVMALLHRRKMAFVNNGKAAVAAHDKEAALEFVKMSKMFDQAILALETASADDLDLNDIPSTPPPYRKRVEPTSFVEHLEVRLQRYQDMAAAAKKEGNERKVRMNMRTVATYQEAIGAAKRGQPVNVADLPFLPDMLPLPPQGSGSRSQPVAAQTSQNSGPAPGMKPPPAVGPLANSGPSGVSRNATQLQFLLQRQSQFKEAALAAKNRGDMDLAKKYLLNAKGFDKMIVASKNGLPVNIKDTPIPPQVSTPATALQPKIVPSTTSSTGVEGRGEALAMLEKGLIEQIQLAENNRMKFTRLGDVGKVKLFEGWAKTAKQDLLLIREVARQGLKLPMFHIENRQIPSADLFPDLAEDVLEMTICQCRDVPLPAGYEVVHANIFIRYTFPYPTESLQTGKSRTVAGTTSPEFDETVIFQIGSKKTRGSKLSRVLKRAPLKIEKGGFLRSDKLVGSCEWKLDELEGKAEMEESLPLKEGRKAVGGLISLRVRIREPLGDTKLQISTHKWIVLDA